MARIGIDIGGTFTDVVLRRDDGPTFVAKVASTTLEPERAVVEGVAAALRLADLAPAAVRLMLHGTTVGSNTILERKGARTGLLTTQGFRDVLEIGRVRTPDLFDVAWDKPPPLARRRDRAEVEERMAADGEPLRAPDLAAAVATARALVADGIGALAICFINSYRNPAHEEAVAAAVRAALPDLPVSASCEILPQIKEYERTSTTVVNAHILPVMKRYLERLEGGLAGLGIAAPLLVVDSNGGAARAEEAARRPVFFIGSGPAAGVVGAARAGAERGLADLIAFDMGGTTAKASLIAEGAIGRTNEYEFRAGISTPSRFIKAGGYMLKVPAIDVAEVGAGAGSIARVDAAGLLTVGPDSAGGDPGPACYRRGGQRATVTDANVVLGFLNPVALAGGTLPVDVAAARSAIERDVAGPLGLRVEAAAAGIRSVANAAMVRALRTVTVERGRDPRDFRLIAFGGSGPVHACDLASMLEIRHVVVPAMAGVFTAVGMLSSRVERHFVEAFPGPAARLASAEATAAIRRLSDAARRALAAEGYAGDRLEIRVEADLQLETQDNEIAVALADPVDLEAALARFRTEYHRLFQYHAGDDIEVTALRVTASGIHPSDGGSRTIVTAGTVAAGSTRPVLFDRFAPAVETPVVDAATLPGRTVAGPLIVESYDGTAVVPPAWSGRMAEDGTLTLEHAP
jgi:N-methylhydantoinase A